MFNPCQIWEDSKGESRHVIWKKKDCSIILHTISLYIQTVINQLTDATTQFQTKNKGGGVCQVELDLCFAYANPSKPQHRVVMDKNPFHCLNMN